MTSGLDLVVFDLFGTDPLVGPAPYHLASIQFAVLDTPDSRTFVSFANVELYTTVDPVDPSDIIIDAASGDVTLPPPAAPVPLPPTILLMGSGLLALATQRRRFKK